MKLSWEKHNHIVGATYSVAKYREYTIEISTTKSSRNYSRYSHNDSIEMITNHRLLIYRNSSIIHVDSFKYDLRTVKRQSIEKLLEIMNEG